MIISIVGLGLVGGSLGLALKQLGDSSLRVVGIPRREETIKQALAMGAIDEGTTDHLKGCANADVVFICTPINLITPIVSGIAPHLKKGAIVTDVGSTKYEIVSHGEKATPAGVFFVGGHPMAGKETTKLESAAGALFKDKIWIITKTSRTSSRALGQLEKLIERIGAKTLITEPKTHDLVVAAISHLPLAAAAALVNTVAEDTEKDLMAKCASSGFRDTTRVASGDPILGVDIFTTNKRSVLKMLGGFKKSISELEGFIKNGDGEKIKEYLEKAKTFRDSFLI